MRTRAPPTWCSRPSHPALSPYLPEAHQAVLAAAINERSPDLVVLENTTAGLDLGAAAAAATGLPVRRLLRRAGGRGRRGAVGQRDLRGTAPRHRQHAASGGVRDQQLGPARRAAGCRARRARLSSRRRPELESLRTTFVEPVEQPDEGVDLTKADRIVCVGRGIGSKENVEIAEELAEALDAEVGASRPVIDSGWLPKVRQVGKSGAHVTPKLYLSLGVSGAPEHVEGMQGAELIVAVNTDPGAAIFHIAHYGVVADLFDVADELTNLLGE